jgi:endonuclease V-like protein UPF0215 family
MAKEVRVAARTDHVIGVDDGPFPAGHRGDVDLIGAVCAGARLDGVLRSRVRRDGANATVRIAEMIAASRYLEQLQLVLLQGIAVAGFNVVDIEVLHRSLGFPVVVVARRRGDWEAIRDALLEKVPGGQRKWRIIERTGPPREGAGVWLQTAGIGLDRAAATVARLAVHSRIPEPLRLAHLIASGVSDLATRQRV